MDIPILSQFVSQELPQQNSHPQGMQHIPSPLIITTDVTRSPAPERETEAKSVTTNGRVLPVAEACVRVFWWQAPPSFWMFLSHIGVPKWVVPACAMYNLVFIVYSLSMWISPNALWLGPSVCPQITSPANCVWTACNTIVRFRPMTAPAALILPFLLSVPPVC